MSIYTPTERTIVGVPYIDARGRANVSRWLQPGREYLAHLFDDGSILLKVVS